MVAIGAIVVALAGTSYAAFSLPRNSVGTNQLKNGAVTGAKLQNGAVTSAKVKDGSLLAADFKTGQVPAGPQGVQGTPGLMALKTVDGAILSLAPGGFDAPPDAQCPPGMYVVGTGFNGPFNDVGGFVEAYGTFVGGFFENASSITLDGSVQAICAQIPPEATVASARNVRAARSRYTADLTRAIALVRRERALKAKVRSR